MDILFQDLRLPAEEQQQIGIWGQRHLHYLKQYRKVIYINLLTTGKHNAYLANIDRPGARTFRQAPQLALLRPCVPLSTEGREIVNAFISLHKPSNLDFSSFSELFSFLVFYP